MPAVGVAPVKPAGVYLEHVKRAPVVWDHPGIIKKPSLGRKLRDQPSLEVSQAVNKTKILPELQAVV